MLTYYETLTDTCQHANYDIYFDRCEDCGYEPPAPELVTNCCGVGVAGTAEDIQAVNHSLTTCPECGEHCAIELAEIPE